MEVRLEAERRLALDPFEKVRLFNSYDCVSTLASIEEIKSRYASLVTLLTSIVLNEAD